MADTMVQDRTVTGILQFTVPTGEKLVTQVSATGGGQNDPKTGQYEMKEITIHDGRPIADELDMEVQGFEFLEYPTAVTDFTDDEQVKNVYYPELEKLLLRQRWHRRRSSAKWYHFRLAFSRRRLHRLASSWLYASSCTTC